MLKTVLLSTAALALLATSADAHPELMLSKDHRFVTALPQKGDHVIVPGKKNKYVYETIASNPEGAYFCCYGSTLSGASSFLGKAYGVAEQFTLSSATSVTELAAAVGYVSGTHKVYLTLYSDNGSNSPGTQLAQGTGTSNTEFGYCCGITTAKISSTKLSANTPYWIGITAYGGTDYSAAPFQVNDEVDDEVYIAGTSDGGSTWGSGYQETEYNPAIGLK
jgi:hypothetical protein